VEVHGWVSPQEFVDVYALTRATPGPSMLIVCLLGYKAYGWLGMAAATLGMFGPSTLVVVAARKLWNRSEKAWWRPRVERVMAPIAVGTVFSAATMIARSADHNAATVMTTLVAAGVVGFTRWGPLPTLVVAGLAGGFGWLA
jgi:chromate transporter